MKTNNISAYTFFPSCFFDFNTHTRINIINNDDLLHANTLATYNSRIAWDEAPLNITIQYIKTTD